MSIFSANVTSLRQASLWRNLALFGVVAALALAVPVTGAILIGEEGRIDSVNGFVEFLSGSSGSFLGSLGFVAPMGFAFAAGLVSGVNPCGFVMLPAYLGMYLGSSEKEDERSRPIRRLGRALRVGGAVTAGFILLFSVAGAVIGLGAHTVLESVIPWFGLGVGVALAFIGAWLVAGGKLYAGFAARVAARIGDPRQVSVRGYFLFGLSYGIASLSCTLTIFLAVVGTSLAVSSIPRALGQFMLYALGMGLVIVTLTVGMALFKEAVVEKLQKALPYIQPVGVWLMVLAGSYIIFYWLTIGGLM